MKNNMSQKLPLGANNLGRTGTRLDNSGYWKEYYSQKAARRDTVRESEYANFLKFLSYKAAKVLDLASGCGFLPLEMNRVGFDVTCLDRNQEMIEVATQYLAKYGVKLPIVKADVVKLPFDKEMFDVVTGMSILEHLPMLEVKNKFFKEISRVLKADGLVLIHVPVRTSVTVFKKWYRTNIIKDLPTWAMDDDGDVTHRMWLSITEYAKLIESNGFKIDYIRFNYSRSNEKLLFMKLLNAFVSIFDGTFMKWGEEPSLKFHLLSGVAVSAAFVGHKVI